MALHKQILSALALGMLVCLCSMRAQPIMRSHVLGSGGAVFAGNVTDTIRLSGTVGQTLATTPEPSASQSLWEGFWVPWRFEMTSIEVSAAEGDRLEVFPNPFTSRTTIRLPRRFLGEVSIVLFNLAGERVRTLTVEAGGTDRTEVPIDAYDDLGDGLPTGVYILEVSGSMSVGTALRLHGMIHLVQ
ncbi:MAG: T9SS type A sorting domain-containing protein [Candidatus Kapabacteria bacterium]|nr:T9SS type A sorting domain-containing protein [Candidatus Kapabacteria bacterium]